jgi:outer membrane protein OmpA-like peptidoglycan-associated protein
VIFLFTDGQFTGERRPSVIARRIARNTGVCFYVISSASEEKNKTIVQRVAGINECSRVIPFSRFIDRPEYTSGALFEVGASEMLVTRTESKIVGLEIDPVYFGFDSTELNDASRSELDEVADFLASNESAYVVINGYTDTSGPEEHNLTLSRQRTESAAAYLTGTRGISDDRIIRNWYGPQNPVASNDTAEGRRKNRRLEMAVGGL